VNVTANLIALVIVLPASYFINREWAKFLIRRYEKKGWR
jgi:hypothetical protein